MTTTDTEPTAETEPTTRARLHQLIIEIANDMGVFHVSAVAEKVLANHHDVYADWVNEHATTILSGYVSDILRRHREHLNSQNRKDALDDKLSRVVDGEDPRQVFACSYVVNERDEHKPLGKLTGADHLFVARGYSLDAKQSQVREALHRAVAKKVGTKTTEEVYTPDQWIAMFRQYTEGAA